MGVVMLFTTTPFSESQGVPSEFPDSRPGGSTSLGGSVSSRRFEIAGRVGNEQSCVHEFRISGI